MNFTDLVNAVIVETKRPDMGLVSNGGDGTIPQKVQAATLYCHCFDNFYKDIQEGTIVFDTPTYRPNIETSGIPNFRQFHAIRRHHHCFENNGTNDVYYLQGTAPLPYLYRNWWGIDQYRSKEDIEIIDADDIWDNVYLETRKNVGYQAGNTFHINSSHAIHRLMLAWYAYPNLGTAALGYSDYSSWIAIEQPFAIIYHAVSSVFSTIGKQEQARKLDGPEGQNGLVQMYLGILQRNNITAKGR